MDRYGRSGWVQSKNVREINIIPPKLLQQSKKAKKGMFILNQTLVKMMFFN
jgi:hypothetical protein